MLRWFTVGRSRLHATLSLLILIIIGLPAVGLAPSLASAQSRAQAAGTVTIQRGKIFVDGRQFNIRGVNYNPTPIGSDTVDPSSPGFDIPRIAALGANTLGTYHAGRAEWGKWSDVTSGEAFYDALAPVAEARNLKIVVGYLSNHTMDWTDESRVARATAQYQGLVLKARNRPSTLIYLIGNEVFEKLASDVQRTAYAGWIGGMVTWTHANDPRHPIVYADSHALPGLKWLKADAPALDIYGVNNYMFTTPESLSAMLVEHAKAWPGKPLLLHEWGTDSWNAERGATDEQAQSVRLKELAAAINAAYADTTHPFLGSLYFAYSDEWRFVGPWTTQDSDLGWPCPSCFDGRANEDHWGLARAVVASAAGARHLKTAYGALQSAWSTQKAARP